MSKWIKGLRAKLLIMGVIPVLVLAVLSYISLGAIGEFHGRLNSAYKTRAKLIEAAGEMDSGIHALGRWMWITYALVGQAETRIDFIKKSYSEIENFEKTKIAYLALPRSAKTTELFTRVEKEWPLAKMGAEEALNLFKTQTEKDNELAKQVMLTKVVPYLGPITKTMDEIKIEMHLILEKEIESADSFSTMTERQVMILSSLSMVFCFGFSIFLAAALARRLTSVSVSLHEASLQVHAASSQIASSSEELSKAATEQASSLEQTAASLEEISSMIAKSSEGSKMASTRSSESQTKAEEGRASVDQMINSMDEISQSNEAIMVQVNQSNLQMADIIKVIHQIGEKTKVINDIVFQTKLLSFNASVEAARAGEHGKGFAVVAEEVGNLAQMSGNAAREISDMLAGSISKVETIVQETKAKVESLISLGKQKVDSGVSVAKQCAEVLTEIVENVSKVSGLAHEISSASQEQAQGVAEINKAMSQMDTVTQQNAATSEETASAAEELSAQSETLKSAVEDLVRTVEGGQSGGPTSMPGNTSSNSRMKPQKQSARVIHLKAAKKSSNSNFDESRVAVGDNMTPDRNHDGFKDV